MVEFSKGKNPVRIFPGCENQIQAELHGCARVAHCVSARWRNFSHYCRPLRHYDVSLRVLITEKHWQPRRQHTVYRNKRLEFATEQVGKLRYVTSVDGGLKRFPWVAWFAHPCWIGSNWITRSHNSSQAMRNFRAYLRRFAFHQDDTCDCDLQEWKVGEF